MRMQPYPHPTMKPMDGHKPIKEGKMGDPRPLVTNVVPQAGSQGICNIVSVLWTIRILEVSLIDATVMM